MTQIFTLLMLASQLLAAVQANPNLPQATRDNAFTIATNAIQYANTYLANYPVATTTPTTATSTPFIPDITPTISTPPVINIYYPPAPTQQTTPVVGAIQPAPAPLKINFFSIDYYHNVGVPTDPNDDSSPAQIINSWVIRVSSNKPLNFAATTISQGTIGALTYNGKHQGSTYYYEAFYTGPTGTTVSTTFTDTDGLTATKETYIDPSQH